MAGDPGVDLVIGPMPDPNPNCEHCGHRMVHHGDRAITACDGGLISFAFYMPYGQVKRANCECPGWKAAS